MQGKPAVLNLHQIKSLSPACRHWMVGKGLTRNLLATHILNVLLCWKPWKYTAFTSLGPYQKPFSPQLQEANVSKTAWTSDTPRINTACYSYVLCHVPIFSAFSFRVILAAKIHFKPEDKKTFSKINSKIAREIKLLPLWTSNMCRTREYIARGENITWRQADKPSYQYTVPKAWPVSYQANYWENPSETQKTKEQERGDYVKLWKVSEISLLFTENPPSNSWNEKQIKKTSWNTTATKSKLLQ